MALEILTDQNFLESVGTFIQNHKPFVISSSAVIAVLYASVSLSDYFSSRYHYNNLKPERQDFLGEPKFTRSLIAPLNMFKDLFKIHIQKNDDFIPSEQGTKWGFQELAQTYNLPIEDYTYKSYKTNYAQYLRKEKRQLY